MTTDGFINRYIIFTDNVRVRGGHIMGYQIDPSYSYNVGPAIAASDCVDRHEPNELVVWDIAATIHSVLMDLDTTGGQVVFITEPEDNRGPLGGRPTTIYGLVDPGGDHEPHQGFIVSVYADQSSTEKALSKLEERKYIRKVRKDVEALISGEDDD